MIKIDNLSFTIDDKKILDNINLNIEDGKIFGIIGPNGVGKTTLLRCLTGIYKPSNGQVIYDDANVYDNINVKSKIGYVPDENIIQVNFKVCEVIKFYKYTYKNFDEKRFDELNEVFNIPKNKFIFQLSKGMKMRLSIMLSLSIHAKYLVLDEPTSGLDVILKKKLLNIFAKEVCENKTTIIISSHHLDELERICDDVAILDYGKVSYENSIENMKNKIKKIQVAFKEGFLDDNLNFDGIINISKLGRVYTIITDEFDDKFLENLNKLNPLFIEEIDLSLEDMFIYKIEEGKVLA